MSYKLSFLTTPQNAHKEKYGGIDRLAVRMRYSKHLFQKQTSKHK